MAGLSINLNAFTENASRLGARLSESITEHTRDLAITRGLGSTYFDAPEEKVRNARKQLDSSSDREKLDALKTLIALISKGRNVSEFFPYVVKNVASQNLEIRKLVYIFLLRYAESDPDLALLSINTFQKDLADPNPLIRAMALRVLSGINVPMIGNIIVLAIKKCAGDPSPYVRKAAALASIKCFNMDSNHLPSLIPILSTLLKDKSPLSIGAVAIAFQTICPTRLDLLHKHYRRLCRMLIDADAWGQINMLEMLSRYARSMLARPVAVAQDTQDNGSIAEEVDPDLQLLLSNAEPLLMSGNHAVVMSVIRVFYYLGPPSYRSKIVNPLLRLLATTKEIERIILSYILLIVRMSPEHFVSHHARFFIRATDTPLIKREKLRILLHLITPETHQVLLREFVTYAEDFDENLMSDSIKAIGQCARTIPDSVPSCLSALMGFIKQGNESAVSASVLVLKSLVQVKLYAVAEQPLSNNTPATQSILRIIADLAGRIDEVNHPSARACIIWLVGQYATIMPEDQNADSTNVPGVALWAPDVLRRVSKNFTKEAPIVKLQIITLAAKLHVITSENHKLNLLMRYVFSLARYDANYDVRDRSRMLSSMLAGITPNLRLLTSNGHIHDENEVADLGGVVLRREQIRLVLFDGKREDHEDDPHSGNSDILGSLEIITEKTMGLDSSRRLPEWPEEGTDSSLRDAEEEYPSIPITAQGVSRGTSGTTSSANLTSSVVLAPTSGSSTPNASSNSKLPWTDLDKFYEDEESSDEDEEDSDDEEEDIQGGSIAPLTSRDAHSDGDSDEDSDRDSDESEGSETNNAEDIE